MLGKPGIFSLVVVIGIDIDHMNGMFINFKCFEKIRYFKKIEYFFHGKLIASNSNYYSLTSKMSSRITRSTAQQIEAANTLVSLANSNKPVGKKNITRGELYKFRSMHTFKENMNTMVLRDRSKLKTPNMMMF